MTYLFQYDKRLGISVPVLDKEWEKYTIEEQNEILKQWEYYRSDIPERIRELEKEIFQKLQALGNEDDFKRSCELNDEISELASTINDLNIWYRIQQETDTKVHQ